MSDQAQISSGTTFDLEIVLLLVTLAFQAGIWWFGIKSLGRRLDDLEKKAVRKHWFRNWLTVLTLENPKVKVPNPDEIKSQE